MKFAMTPFVTKGKFLLAGAFALAAALGGVSARAASDVGDVVFVGDSITQANGANAVSYRYALWKHFVDSGAAYSPLGSVNFYCQNGRPTTSPLAPDYLGKKFDNTNEGHFGWDVAWVVSGEAQGNRPNTGQNTGGLATWMSKYGRAPKTATLLMGVNDLSRGSGGTAQYSFETIIENTKNVVRTLQANSPGVTVHVFSVLPSAQASWPNGRSPRAGVLEYDALLKAAVESGAWNTETSVVEYHDITAGFDPTVHTYDNLHPKAQGELIVAANMARALGLEQRTAGLTRRGNAALASQASFGNASGGNGVVARLANGSNVTEISNASEYWTVNDAGHVVVDSALSGGSDLRVDWGAEDRSSAHEFTVSLTLKMNESSDSSKNFLGVFGGNGFDEVGVLYIGESGIYWGDTSAASLLYGQTNSAYMDQFMMQEANTLRMAWINGREDGVAEGFYVWLNDMLIGEALSGNTNTSIVGSYKDTLLFGDIGASYVTSAEIFALSFDATTAWAPDVLAIPEPSAFGLFAGLGALALCAVRRRRSRR